jgi:hypothetical protein
MSVECTLMKELEHINRRYYRYIHVYNRNEILDLNFKTKIKICVLFTIRAN